VVLVLLPGHRFRVPG